MNNIRIIDTKVTYSYGQCHGHRMHDGKASLMVKSTLWQKAPLILQICVKSEVEGLLFYDLQYSTVGFE